MRSTPLSAAPPCPGPSPRTTEPLSPLPPTVSPSTAVGDAVQALLPLGLPGSWAAEVRVPWRPTGLDRRICCTSCCPTCCAPHPVPTRTLWPDLAVGVVEGQPSPPARLPAPIDQEREDGVLLVCGHGGVELVSIWLCGRGAGPGVEPPGVGGPLPQQEPRERGQPLLALCLLVVEARGTRVRM